MDYTHEWVFTCDTNNGVQQVRYGCNTSDQDIARRLFCADAVEWMEDNGVKITAMVMSR